MIVKDLHVNIEGKEILKGITLSLEKGKVYAIMGPNGSGKSTLANVLMGHPKFEVTQGTVELDGVDLLNMEVDARAKKGVFLSFQYPVSVSGVTLTNFLRMAYNNTHTDQLSVVAFHKMLKEKMQLLGMDSSFGRRYLNEGFSGGEKKRAEMLQMLTLEPTWCVLDETDSGLDVDALKVVAKGINKIKSPKRSVCLITHYNRILKFVKPDKVFVLVDGKIVKEGGAELADNIEKNGFEQWTKNQ